MNILGISALYHDSAAALCVNSEIIAAAQEERFTRIKGDSSFPANSIKYCLSKMNGKLDAVAFYDNPILTLDRFLYNLKGNEQSDVILKKETYKVFGERLTICKTIREFLHNLEVNDDYKIYVCKHHISHAASAFYPSPFEKAAFLINDGVGEWATTTLGVGKQTKLTVLKELLYPDSLGLLYSTFTAFCGFKVNFGEYKLMGLAPYGSPKWVKQILENIVDLKDDGSFKLNPSYFKYREYQQMYSDEFAKLFGIAPRTPESKIDIAYMDIAASIQEVTNLIILKQARYLRDITNCKNLVLAGGCALNCVSNGLILKEGIFENVWIQPAANDSGGSIGAALYAYYELTKSIRIPSLFDSQKGSFLGPEFSNDEIYTSLLKHNANFKYYEDAVLYKEIASRIKDNKVIGLFHGRLEFGPRALGHRSIIANAFDDNMQKRVNLKIKFRESFRPFAPAVLTEDSLKYFNGVAHSPYMLLVTSINDDIKINNICTQSDDIIGQLQQKRSKIPAVTHVDYSARIQTVDFDRNPFLYNILQEYKQLTGESVILNTSFNVRGEPIVCTPDDAISCFYKTGMDVLVIGNYIVSK